MNDNQENCYLRLPCGICRLTMTNCPKVSDVYSITSTCFKASCEANTVEKEVKDDGSV